MWRIKCVQYVGKLWISAKALGKNWHHVGNHKGMPRFQHPSIFKNHNCQSWRHFQRYYLALIPRMVCKYRLLPAGPQIRVGTKRKKHTKCSNVQQLEWSSEHVTTIRLQQYSGDSTESCLVCCIHLSLISPWGKWQIKIAGCKHVTRNTENDRTPKKFLPSKHFNKDSSSPVLRSFVYRHSVLIRQTKFLIIPQGYDITTCRRPKKSGSIFISNIKIKYHSTSSWRDLKPPDVVKLN